MCDKVLCVCLSQLCATMLCVKEVVCDKVVCEQVVCERECNKRRRRMRSGIQNQKQEPHTKMWGNRKSRFAITNWCVLVVKKLRFSLNPQMIEDIEKGLPLRGYELPLSQLC